MVLKLFINLPILKNKFFLQFINSFTMIKAINKTFSILNKKEKRELYILTITKFFSGLMDMVGIASILPFLAFISNENLFGQNKVILKIQSYFNFQDTEMTIFLAAVSLSLLLLNYSFKIFDT